MKSTIKKCFAILFILFTALLTTGASPQIKDEKYYWLKIQARDKFERSILAENGIAIEIVSDDYVIAYGGEIVRQQLIKSGKLIASSDLALEKSFRGLDFPTEDQIYHNYQELTDFLNQVARENPDILKLSVIGKTIENRDIYAVRMSSNMENASQKPGFMVMGGHHAREHLSVEMPIQFIKYLVQQYRAGNSRIVGLIANRDLHIIPAVNPDGLEFDISTSSYKMWRKNRKLNRDGSYGVDLNRNYSFQWGTGGSSTNPTSDTYMGTEPFSEPETQAIKKYVEQNENVTVLLSFHSYSKLILYPWGHKYDGIEDSRDQMVHQKMAERMSTWNGYEPQQSSELYIASGDTTDWSYGVHKIFSFTFELDPSGGGFGGGGFYPGPGAIQSSFQKNIEPLLYMADLADNPYRVLNFGIGPINP